MTTDTVETWYRIEDRLYAIPDGWGEYVGSRVDVTLLTFTVVKHTPKGVWLSWGFGSNRFVLNGARKRFACPTIEAALESFGARKLKQASIYQSRANRAHLALDIALRRFGKKVAA